MLKSNAEIIKHLAESTKVVVEAGLGSNDQISEVLAHISSLIDPYIQKEQEIFFMEFPTTCLSGAEAEAFEKQMKNNSYGETIH